MRTLLLALALAALPAAAQSDHSHDDGHGQADEGRSGAGRLTFDAETHAFGSFREGQPAEVTFRFTNTGTEPVTLADVQASCGCTTPRYTTDPVAPGGTGEIVVAYDSQGRPGPFEKTITLAADGATPRVTTLRISGTVVADFAGGGVAQGNLTFDADLWDAAEVPAGGGVTHAFQFQNNGAAPVRITAVRTVPEGVEVSFPDRPVFTDDVAALMVIVDDVSAIARPNGRFQVALSVETTDPVQPVKSLLLRGRVGQPAAATETSSAD